MAKADIELLFGVAGGGTPSGPSGKKIQNQLNNIIGHINKNPLEIKITPDVKSFQKQLSNLTAFAQSEAKKIADVYQAAMNSIKLTPPPNGSNNNNNNNNNRGAKKQDYLIAPNSSEYLDALSKLQNYQYQIQKMQKDWSLAAQKGSKSEYAMKRISDELSNLEAYRRSLDAGTMSASKFSEHMKNVGITIKQATAEVRLFGEGVSNHLIPKGSVEQLSGLTDVQKYISKIKKMQEDWTAASAPGAKSVGAMGSLNNELAVLEALETGLKNGTVQANVLADRLQHAGAVIAQVDSEVKRFGENKSLIDLSSGTEENLKALNKVDKLLISTKNNYNKWTAAAKGSTAGDYSGLKTQILLLESLHRELAEGKITYDQYVQKYNSISSSIDRYSNNIKAAGKATKGFGDNLKDLFGKFSKWFSVSRLVMRVIQTIRQMLTNVKDIDSAMTELRKVTDESEATYDRFLSNATDRAKKLGATLTDVVSASANFAKIGKSISEASDLADAAIVYKNVGDNIDSIDAAAGSIISTMQAFTDENLTAMEIVDKFNATGNSFAITSTGIGDALQRSAAAMNAAGNSLDQTIALVTAANTIVQNPESVGTTMKTLSMYLRAAKTEAEEAGESTEGMADSMSELRSEILRLTGNKVDIQIDENTFKSTYQILKELSEEWDNLTDISKANLLEMIGGKRNANVVSALLENFDIAEKALKTSADSAGSALRENEKYLDSIQGKIQKFQASWQTLSSSIFKTEFVKGVVDSGRVFVEAITWMTDSLGVLGTAITAITAKGVFQSLMSAFKLSGIQEAERALAAVKLMAGDASKGISGWSKTAAMSMTGANASTIAYIKTLGVASASELTFGQCVKVASMNLSANTKMILANAAAWFASPLGMATIAAAGIFAIAKAVKYFSEELERSREKLSELSEEYTSNESELKSLNDELETTKNRIEELQSLKDSGAISITEQEELDNLNSQNTALARKIELLKIEQELKKADINRQFVKTGNLELNNIKEYKVTGSLTSGNYDPENVSTKKYGKGRSVRTFNEQEYVRSVLMRREEIIEQLSTDLTDKEEEKLQKTLVDIDTFLAEEINKLQTDLDTVSFMKGATTEDQKAANEMILVYEDMLDRIAISTGKESSRTNAFNRLIDTEFDDATKKLKELGKEGAVTAEMLKDPAYSDFVEKCINLGVVSDSSTESLNFLALGFNNVTKAASESGVALSGSAISIDSINQSIDDVQSRISSLGDSFAKLRDGSLTLEEAIDLIQEFPELAEYVDLTSESFGDLDKGLQKLIRHAPDELIDELQNFKKTADLTDKQREAIDDLCVSMEKLSTDAITDASEEFGILAEAINASKRAKSELDKELAKDDYDANYEDRIEAFKGLQEVMKSGEYGSKAFDAYKDYFDIEELDSDGVKKWIQKNNKYFSDGKQGVVNFLKEVERLNNVGLLDESIATYDSATKVFAYDITQIEAIGEAFGWSGEMVQDFVGKFRMYSEDFIDRTTEITQKELLMRDYIQNFGDVAIVSMEKLQSYTGYTEQGVRDLVDQMNALNTAVESELRALSEGGNVNLNLRPEIDTSELLKKGWAEELVGEAGNIATVFSSTFSNQAGNIAMNFTPIQVDENGNYIGVLDPETFEQYCYDIIDGVREDDLNLKIGATYTGHDAIKQAEMDANRIHELHAMLRASGEIKILGVDDIHITQSIVDSMEEALGSIDEVKSALYDLSNTKGVTFDTGVQLNGRSIEDIIAEAQGSKNGVSVDIKLNVDDEEITVKLETTEEKLNAINKEWQAVLTGNTEDVESKKEFTETLLTELEEDITTVTVDGYVKPAVDGLNSVSGLLDTVASKKYQLVTIEYETKGSPPQFAAGTKHAPAGPALLGDEYSPDGSPKPELVITNGAAYVVGQDGPEIVNLNKGDQVLNADETKRVLSGSVSYRKSKIPAFASGATVPAWKLAFERQEAAKKELTAKREAEKNTQTIVDGLSSAAATAEKIAQKSNSTQKNTPTYTTGKVGGTADLKGGTTGGSGVSGGGSGSSGSSSSSTKEKSQFEKDYEAHQHQLAMEKESYEDYLKWLEGAYEDAYNKGEIELEDYRKYMEEVFEGQKELFQDSIEDIEHKIKFLEREPGNEREIINYYNRIITKIDAEIAAARARGLNDDDDYIQELLEQKWDYADEIADIEEEITENAKDAVDELVDYRVDMLKQEIEDHKDALNDKLDTLKDFYDEQKQMLQDSYDEEKYLEEQNEKRRSVSDIKDELEQLRFDNSAAAEKRKLELQEELKAAEKDLSDFEKDKALQDAMDLLDKQYEQQEKDIQSQIDELDAKLNDPNALFNQALSDIKHNTAELYGEMVAYNNAHGDGNPETIKEMYDSAKESLDQFLKTFGEAYKDILLVSSSSSAVTGYASGTSHATKGVHELFEGGKDEYVYQTKDGHRYKMFSGLGDKVLNASATDFLYKFANNGEAFMTNMIKSLFGSLSPTSLIRSPGTVSVSTGDIVIQGNADSATVSEIRRAQRENVNHILREFVKLNR